MTTILYNGSNPFIGIAPTPLISHSISPIHYGSRWGQLDTYVLNGYITGCNLGTPEFRTKQLSILSSFSQDYKSLVFQDNGVPVLSLDEVKVESINFDPSNYAGQMLPFQITLESYPSQYFQGEFGVLNPSEEVSFEEGEDGLVSINHSVSANGFCTSSSQNNAFENAQNWVADRTGWSSQVLPAFISFNNTVCLNEINQIADRINGRYEVKEKYISDQFDNGAGILRYTSEYAYSPENGLTTVSIRGDIKGCLGQSIDSLRLRYKAFNAFNEAVNQLKKASGKSNLNQIPLSKSVAEDSNNGVITFEYVYNDDFRPQISISYDFSFEYDYESDVVSVQVEATIAARGAYSSDLWNQIKSTNIDLYSIASQAYRDYLQIVAPSLSDIPLNPNPVSISRTENELQSRLVLSATFNNLPVPPVGLDKFDYTVTVSPAIRQYAPYPILDKNGEYYIFDLGFVRRGNCSIEIAAHTDENTSIEEVLPDIKNRILTIQNDVLPGTKKTLENQSISKSITDARSLSISAVYGAEQSEFSIT